jgi:hypothetical protein
MKEWLPGASPETSSGWPEKVKAASLGELAAFPAS